ncbi:MAG: hypothetical protein ACKODK_18620, partial [Opitutaceae bacterium]
ASTWDFNSATVVRVSEAEVIGRSWGGRRGRAISAPNPSFYLARRLQHETWPTVLTMSARHQHHVRRAGACFMQAWQRPGAPRPAIVSVWNKKAGSGHQN